MAGIRLTSTSAELKDQDEPKIVTVSLVFATTKSYFPLQRWQWTNITCIITAVIFTAQKFTQQKSDSIQFHYSEKGNSVLISENSSHKTCRKAQKGQKRKQQLERGGRTPGTCRQAAPSHSDTSAWESSSLREGWGWAASFLPTSASHNTLPTLPISRRFGGDLWV